MSHCCDICNKNIISQNKYLCQDEYYILLNLFHHDIIDIILSYYSNFIDNIYFIINPTRIKPKYLDKKEFCKNKTSKICQICFQSGIYYSLESQHRLPYNRTDIDYFYKFKFLILEQQENLIKKMKLKHRHYIFPQNYKCTYYRKKYPILIEHNYWKVTDE